MTTKGVKLMADGSASVVVLEGQRQWKLSDPLWDSLQKEINTTSLHFNSLLTRKKDVLYEMYYDNSGDSHHPTKRNELAEEVTGLAWFGPCIIMKVKPTGRILTMEDIYKDHKEYVDALSVEEERDVGAYLMELSQSLQSEDILGVSVALGVYTTEELKSLELKNPDIDWKKYTTEAFMDAMKEWHAASPEISERLGRLGKMDLADPEWTEFAKERVKNLPIGLFLKESIALARSSS